MASKTKKNKGYIFDKESLTIRGSAVNLFFTAVLIFLIAYGAFSAKVASNLKSLETLIIGVYAISFGVWQGKKLIENRTNGNCNNNNSDEVEKMRERDRKDRGLED